MLISGVYYAIRTSAILTSLNVGLCGTDRRFIFDSDIVLHLLRKLYTNLSTLLVTYVKKYRIRRCGASVLV